MNSSTLSASPLLAVILRSAVSKYAAFFFNLSFPFSSSFLRWGQAISQAACGPLYSGHFFVVLPSGWSLVLCEPEYWPYTTSSLYWYSRWSYFEQRKHYRNTPSLSYLSYLRRLPPPTIPFATTSFTPSGIGSSTTRVDVVFAVPWGPGFSTFFGYQNLTIYSSRWRT